MPFYVFWFFVLIQPSNYNIILFNIKTSINRIVNPNYCYKMKQHHSNMSDPFNSQGGASKVNPNDVVSQNQMQHQQQASTATSYKIVEPLNQQDLTGAFNPLLQNNANQVAKLTGEFVQQPTVLASNGCKCPGCISANPTATTITHSDQQTTTLTSQPINNLLTANKQRLCGSKLTGRQLAAPGSWHFPQPIRILLEPRNDDSVRCDCRNCQFFSGWCCMPCALLIIIVLIVFFACSRMSAAPSAPQIVVADNKTLAQNISMEANTTTSTTTTLQPSTSVRSILTGNEISLGGYEETY